MKIGNSSLKIQIINWKLETRSLKLEIRNWGGWGTQVQISGWGTSWPRMGEPTHPVSHYSGIKKPVKIL